MSVLSDLSEEERYLFAILSDESGLDLAEFAYTDETQDDACFRAWPFQWPWWRSEEQLQIDRASRSVGKSLSIKIRAFAFPFINPGEEMVVTAPEGVHLDAVTDNIETLYVNNRLAREMIAKGRGGKDITHRPFKINFANNSRIIGRIPQRDGKGIKGTHPIWLEMDEASDWPEAAWGEIVETVKVQNPKARWRAHGVTRGVGGGFDKRCQPDSGWKVHALPAMLRPTWDDEERRKKIAEYGGSTDAIDYRRNVLGLPGDANSPIFVLSRLMEATDKDEDSDYNRNQYVSLSIDEAEVADVDDIRYLLDMPGSHKSYSNFWFGMDLGWTQAPSSIVIFAEDRDDKKKITRLRLLAKILLRRVSAPDQTLAIKHFLDIYRPRAFALDATGAGLPVYQNLQDEMENDPTLKMMVNRIKGYNFSGKVIAEFDQTVEVDELKKDGYLDAAIYRNVLEWSTDVMRKMLDEKKIILPYDMSIINEFQGQHWTYGKSITDAYGRKKIYSTGAYHTLDACRMAVLAYQQKEIDDFIAASKDTWEPPPMFFL